MRAYGVKRKDFGCCPGHDKCPGPGGYRNKKQKQRPAKKRARRELKIDCNLV